MRQPLRNLANSFTPSPNVARKEKPIQCSADGDVTMEPAKDDSPHAVILNAIQKLTSAYIPANFRHREKEFGEIRAFFRDCFEEKEKTSMYISGAPGCGKTALLKSTEADINELYRVWIFVTLHGVLWTNFRLCCLLTGMLPRPSRQEAYSCSHQCDGPCQLVHTVQQACQDVHEEVVLQRK